MKNKYLLLFIIGILLLPLTALSQPQFSWAKSMGGAGSESGTNVTTDAAGNYYISGTYTSSIDCDPGPGVYTLTPAGGTDTYLIKLNSSGNFVWAKIIMAGSPDTFRPYKNAE